MVCFVTVTDWRGCLGKANEDKEKEEDEGRYLFDLCHYRGEYLMTEKM